MRTKIIATIGPASESSEALEQLIDAGVYIFRLNFSHGDASQFVDLIDRIRELESRKGKSITIMQDLSGPKIRIGKLEKDSLIIIKDDLLALGTKTAAQNFMLKSISPKFDINNIPNPSISKLQPDYELELPFIPFEHETILESLEENDRLVLADGALQFKITKKLTDNLFEMQAQNDGIITSRKGLALPGKSLKLPALTDKDKKDLEDGLKLGIDAVALSYVQTPEDILEAKAIIRRANKNIPVIAKLERQNAVERLDAILAVTDIVMVARGDLGIECPLPELPAMQKRIIRACNQASKPVIVATQMLLSMVNNPSPTRAETTDVANAVLDGADCVMLSEETAMGKYPVQTVEFMHKITKEAENLLFERAKIKEPTDEQSPSDFLAYAACLLANKTNAPLIAHSLSGAAARLISSYRPMQRVYAITPKPEVVKTLNFSWGIRPFLVRDDYTQHLTRVEKFIDDNTAFAEGETLIITAGQAHGGQKSQGTNLIKIYTK